MATRTPKIPARSTLLNSSLDGMDDLFDFKTKEEQCQPEPENGGTGITEMDFAVMEPLPNHKFKLYTGQRLQDMVDSIREFGILEPLIVWVHEGKNAILSGHNRQNAGSIAGLTKGPVIIRENLTYEDAILIATETNLRQRSFDDLSPSEKAYCLKQHYDAIKSQGRRNDLIKEIEELVNPHEIGENGTCSEIQKKLNANEKVSEEYALGKDKIAKYLRIASLISPLMELLDNRKIAFEVAYDISFIKEEEKQYLIAEMIEAGHGVDIKKSTLIHDYAKKGNGRILRQGNENDEISIFNYITEQTFDAYLWQILEQKQRYISQIMTGRSALRSCEDVDEVVLQYAEFKALAVSDPKIKRKMEVDNEVYRLQTLKSAWKSEHTDLQNKITVYYPQEIKKCTERIEHRKADAELYQKEVPQEFSITLNHRLFDERTKAGEYLKMQMANLGHEAGDTVSAGIYAGLQVMLKRGAFQDVLLCLKGEGSYQVDAGESALGNITRLENLAEKIPQYLKDEERKLGELKEQFEAAKVQAERPFSEEEKLSELLKEQVSLNLELEFVDADEEGTEKAGKSHGNSIYRKLRKLAPKLFEGTYTYMKFKQDGFDDLVLETIGENEYSIAHYYTQNGDRMRDPEITFMLDDTQRCIYALSYTQDNMGIYYETVDRTEKQMEDLMGFFDQWMANIKEQGFTLYKAYGEDAEYTKEEEHTEETGYTVISADDLKQMDRFDGEDMENER